MDDFGGALGPVLTMSLRISRISSTIDIVIGQESLGGLSVTENGGERVG